MFDPTMPPAPPAGIPVAPPAAPVPPVAPPAAPVPPVAPPAPNALPAFPPVAVVQCGGQMLWVIGNDYTRGWNGTAWVKL